MPQNVLLHFSSSSKRNGKIQVLYSHIFKLPLYCQVKKDLGFPSKPEKMQHFQIQWIKIMQNAEKKMQNVEMEFTWKKNHLLPPSLPIFLHWEEIGSKMPWFRKAVTYFAYGWSSMPFKCTTTGFLMKTITNVFQRINKTKIKRN